MYLPSRSRGFFQLFIVIDDFDFPNSYIGVPITPISNFTFYI